MAGCYCLKSSINSTDRDRLATTDTRLAVPCRTFKTAYELQDLIVEQAQALHGPWPAGMTLFVFDDAYGWSASVSRPGSEDDLCYRSATLDIITELKRRFDLAVPHLPGPGDG